MSRIIAFSGSRDLAHRDYWRIEEAFDCLRLNSAQDRIAHGACIGVDEAIARCAFARGFYTVAVVPANRSRVFAAWREVSTSWYEATGTTFRDRNAALVRLCERLIAFPAYPKDDPRSRRSGTWQTIRLARKYGKPVEVSLLCDLLTEVVA